MLFDAGQFGMVEADSITEEAGCAVGACQMEKEQVTYFHYGKEGCTKVVVKTAKENAPEAAARNYKELIQICREIMKRQAQEQGALEQGLENPLCSLEKRQDENHQ